MFVNGEGIMKELFYRTLIVLFGTLLIVSSAFAAFMVPDYVYRIDQLKEAQASAKDNGMVITFLYSNENTSCGLATAASLDVIRGLKQRSVIIYVNSKNGNDWKKVPAIVRRALKSSEAGRFIPKTVIVNAEMDKVIFIVPYAGQPERNKLLKEAIEKISE
jgi:hypothetical protein